MFQSFGGILDPWNSRPLEFSQKSFWFFLTLLWGIIVYSVFSSWNMRLKKITSPRTRLRKKLKFPFSISQRKQTYFLGEGKILTAFLEKYQSRPKQQITLSRILTRFVFISFFCSSLRVWKWSRYISISVRCLQLKAFCELMFKYLYSPKNAPFVWYISLIEGY